MNAISRIAIITGVRDEADAFLNDQPAEQFDSPFGAVRTMDHAGKTLAILCSGIGKVHAGAATMYLDAAFNPDLFMVIGTAGQVSTIAGNCFYLHEALQADYGSLEHSSHSSGFTHYDAGTWPIGPATWSPFLAYQKPARLALPSARIATADSFIKCPERSDYLRATLQSDLVDMETAAVAQIAHMLGKPWAAIKAVTDKADGDSSGDFQANLQQAATRAADAAQKFLALL